MYDLSTSRISGLFDESVALSPLLDHLPVGMAVLDAERRTMLLNQALEALTGFSRDEVWKVPCCDVLRLNFCQYDCPVVKVRETMRSVVMEGNIITRNREKVSVRLTTIPLKTMDGRLAGFLETVQDMRLLEKLESRFERAYSIGGMLGRSRKMEELFRILPVIAQTDSSVLITGETGTGKDLLAEAIHQASNQAKDPFVKVNCGALPETLLESELFGHKKGAFTGAVADKPGRIRLAQGGTLYLTEVGDLPLSLQVKLLTFLDDKVVYPLGGTKGFQVDVRVIAATHRNLEQMVREGTFREDLLFRLNVVRLHLPPLRERDDDVILLMDHFLSVFSNRFGKKIKHFDSRARALLRQYKYSGNIRELRNIIEYAANICQDEQISFDHLPAYLTEEPTPLVAELVNVKTNDSLIEVDAFGGETRTDDRAGWSEYERRLIINALLQARGRKKNAAELLGWGRSTLWRKIKQYGIDS